MEPIGKFKHIPKKGKKSADLKQIDDDRAIRTYQFSLEDEETGAK